MRVKPSKTIYIIPFILVAALLWYGNKLANTYKAEIEVPIQLTFDYNSLGWIENSTMRLNCLVESDGRELVKYDFKIASPIQIQTSFLSYEKRGNENYYKINEETMKEALRSHSKLHILQILDTIPWVKISEIERVTLPIKNNVEISCAKQFMVVGDVKLQPSVISVRAPKSMLDTIKYIQTERVTYENHNKSINRGLALIIPEGMIVLDRQVRLMADITGYTELEHLLNIEVDNLPENSSMISIPSQVRVLIKVPLKSFASDISIPVAKIDYNDRHNQRSNLLKVKITNLPEGGAVTSITPEYVEPFFIIN